MLFFYLDVRDSQLTIFLHFVFTNIKTSKSGNYYSTIFRPINSSLLQLNDGYCNQIFNSV